MHSFEVHSNESACRKIGRLGMEQVRSDWKCKVVFSRKINNKQNSIVQKSTNTMTSETNIYRKRKNTMTS